MEFITASKKAIDRKRHLKVFIAFKLFHISFFSVSVFVETCNLIIFYGHSKQFATARLRKNRIASKNYLFGWIGAMGAKAILELLNEPKKKVHGDLFLKYGVVSNR